MPSHRRVRKENSNPEEGSPHWMTTFSDMVTLLLAFFIMLFSVSIIDIERFHRILASIQMSFLGYTGILDSTTEPQEPISDELVFADQELLEETLQEQREAEDIMQMVRAFLADTGLKEAVEVKREERGIVMELPGSILFERSSADLKPQARHTLDKLSELFKEIENKIVIEGHTCNLPINIPKFPSNWELSVTRAVRVTRYLVETKGMKAGRFMATGYGEYQPLESNDTAEGRAKNRRVTIVISLERPSGFQDKDTEESR